jgi:hypothetical protein
MLNYQRVSENLIQNLGSTGLDPLMIAWGNAKNKGRAPWGKLHSKLAKAGVEEDDVTLHVFSELTRVPIIVTHGRSCLGSILILSGFIMFYHVLSIGV